MISIAEISVHPIPAFQDNYLWIIQNGSHAAIVDPGDATPVIEYLSANNLQLAAIICTHHHADHVGGVEHLLDFLNLRGKIPVFGPAHERIPARTQALAEGDRIVVPGTDLTFDILDVPGHTAGHIAYFGHGMLFCGDTLFACGCGRLFEGTPEQMTESLTKLKHLPPETKVYCAHEYTMANIKFAEAVEPENGDLKLRKAFCAAKRHHNLPTVPSTIHLELATNPFLRWDQPAVRAAAALRLKRDIGSNPAPALVFGAIREWKQLLIMTKTCSILPATESDVATILDLIGQLAVYEKLEHMVTGNEAMLRAALFGKSPSCECVIARDGNAPIGFALYFTTFSTFLCKPGLYLEDLFVVPAARGHGHGKALLKYLAALAVTRDCGRFEWRVLDWNAPSIEFYKSLGATIMPEWHLVRMTGDEISTLAGIA